jgi:hypothetical protein
MPRPDHFLPLTTDHFTAIGKVAMEWNVIEGYIAWLVRVLVDNNKHIGMTMTVNLQSSAHCDLLKALIHQRLGGTPDVKPSGGISKGCGGDRFEVRRPKLGGRHA